jgi:hypothetical protein
MILLGLLNPLFAAIFSFYSLFWDFAIALGLKWHIAHI